MIQLFFCKKQKQSCQKFFEIALIKNFSLNSYSAGHRKFDYEIKKLITYGAQKDFQNQKTNKKKLKKID